ncbi:MAG: cytochrome c-type biogenesis protein CcmH [Rhodobacteraceae bacterium]|nr:cytochrome c-type biogenesis protein CcmH [Paracoccaceae bacterium]
MKAALSILLLLFATPLWALQPDEMLSDPMLEKRARDLGRSLRCLVCRNESIDESHAALARDLRVLVRDRLVAGDTNDEVIAFVVARYGEYVLLRPGFNGSNWLLWAAGPVMLLLGGAVGFGFLRNRQRATSETEADLTDSEQARLQEILKD